MIEERERIVTDCFEIVWGDIIQSVVMKTNVEGKRGRLKKRWIDEI